MSGRNRAARILVALGSIVLFASAALHSLAAYPRVSTALGASNLSARLQEPLRAIFLLVGWDWIVIAVVALLAAFTETKLRKILVLFCGVAVLVETALTLAFIGVFVGNEMIGSAAVLLMVGGLLWTQLLSRRTLRKQAPRRPARNGSDGRESSNHVFVNGDVESPGNLPGNTTRRGQFRVDDKSVNYR